MRAKPFLISIATILGIVLLAIIIWYLLLVKAFSWKPPSTELELTNEEIAWKNAAETRYSFNIDFIGSDDSFMEDSVVYVNTKVLKESPLQTLPIDSFELITKRLAIGFQEHSSDRKEKTCIQFRFYNLLNTNEELTYSSSKAWLYHFKQKAMTTLE